MILSNKQITKALFRLRGSAGWSAPLLFANLLRQAFLRRGPYMMTQRIHSTLICAINSIV